MSIDIKTIIPFWVAWREITIQIDSNRSLPTIDIIWLADNTVKESRERLRASFRQCDVEIPPMKFIINMAPSDIRKSGTLFDIPIATWLLLHILWDNTHFKEIADASIFAGELGLDGSSRGIHGVLPMVVAAKKLWYTHFFIPQDNVQEVIYIPDIIVYWVEHFSNIVSMFRDGFQITRAELGTKNITHRQNTDHCHFNSIQGHERTKRGLAICASGFHNALMVWPPWTGKSMLAKSMKWLLPPMNFEEIVEVSQMYSLVGKLNEDHPLVRQRPFRSIHHTASKVSVIGWGRLLLPWEISLAHNGLLFLDEIPEFHRDVLESLRQPIEEKQVTISRAQGSISYPAKCMILWAMNPCPCGYYKDPMRRCTCSPLAIKRYQSKISWPLLDRFDMILEVVRQDVSWASATDASNVDLIQENICSARERQKKRYRGAAISSNSDLTAGQIKDYIRINTESEEIMSAAQKKLHLSHRWIHRALKVARSIADFEWKDEVSITNILEALQYRAKNDFFE